MGENCGIWYKEDKCYYATIGGSVEQGRLKTEGKNKGKYEVLEVYVFKNYKRAGKALKGLLDESLSWFDVWNGHYSKTESEGMSTVETEN